LKAHDIPDDLHSLTVEFDSTAREWHLKGFVFCSETAIKFLHLAVGVHDFRYSEDVVLQSGRSSRSSE